MLKDFSVQLQKEDEVNLLNLQTHSFCIGLCVCFLAVIMGYFVQDSYNGFIASIDDRYGSIARKPSGISRFRQVSPKVSGAFWAGSEEGNELIQSAKKLQ